LRDFFVVGAPADGGFGSISTDSSEDDEGSSENEDGFGLLAFEGTFVEMHGFPRIKVIFLPGFGCASSAGFTDGDGTGLDGTGA
jgi:hypothetical protein